MDDGQPVFWLTMCKLNSACGKTSEEDTREQSRIPKADSRTVIVAAEEDCRRSARYLKWYCLFFPDQHIHTHRHTDRHRHTCARAPKACSRDGFQHELLDKAVSVMLRTGSARDAWWERPVRKPRDKQTGRCHSPSATPDGLNWKLASWTPRPSLNTFLKHATQKSEQLPVLSVG